MVNAKTVVLGVSGSIAAYKSVEVLRRLQDMKVLVRAVMTRAATRFVGPLTFETLSGHPVHTDIFSESASAMPYLKLAHEADLVLVAPATAATLARAAGGLSDDVLSAVVLASERPVVFAPAMHAEMYKNQATRENLDTLRRRGHIIIEPEVGVLADGETGVGRLAEPAVIVERVIDLLEKRGQLRGRKFLVTAGGTQEPLDPVRFIGNRSSGKMGLALAEEVRDRGGEAVLVSSVRDHGLVGGVRHILAETAADMEKAVLAELAGVHAVIMSAAVADFRPANYSKEKIKKKETLTVELVKNPDVLEKVSQMARNGLGGAGKRPVLVGFAAESEQAVENGRAKLEDKDLDLIVANDIASDEAGFDADYLNFSVLGPDGPGRPLKRRLKSEAAGIIIDEVVSVLDRREGKPK